MATPPGDIPATKPSPEALCTACQTINGKALLKTRASTSRTDIIYYNEAGDIEEEYSTPSVPGVYHDLELENPAASVKICAACRLFQDVCYGGITLSEPTVLRLYLHKDRVQVEVEDVIKVEREKERVKREGDIVRLDGKGRISVFTDFGSVAAEEFPRRTIAQTGSDESMACIRRWVDECDSNHPTCKLGLVGDFIESEPQMPTRVIDVVSFDGPENPRLLETNGLKGKYIAVSHSWGTVVKPYTTTENIDSLKNSINFKTLPKTFQDSIFIARKLEVRYVWIDSICIIQDDREDWKREAKTMGLVYEKAYLTISASKSPGDHAGFLTPNPEVRMDVLLPFQAGVPDSGNLYLRGLYTSKTESRWTAIGQRGWVLQESTLSRRILHFDGTLVHWECSQYLLSEDGTKTDTTSNVTTSYFLGQNIKPLVGKKNGEEFCDKDERREALNTLYHWYVCKVHEFSVCKLTYASDKLPAILGLGNEIVRGTGIQCIEGHLFFEQPLFVYSLLWHTGILSIEDSGIPEKVRAPSWSWAALDGAHVFYLLGIDIKFERRIFLKIERVLQIDGLDLKPHTTLACSAKVVAGTKGDHFPDRHSNTFFGGNRMRNLHEIEEFQPPTFAYRILDPTTDATQRRPRRNNGKGWVCFDSREVRPEDFFFIPVCAPLAGQEHTHPDTTKGCLGLVVVEAFPGRQRELQGFTNLFRRVGFGGLNDTSWFDQRDEIDFLFL